jgi:Na+/H+ antiporter NhaA
MKWIIRAIFIYVWLVSGFFSWGLIYARLQHDDPKDKSNLPVACSISMALGPIALLSTVLTLTDEKPMFKDGLRWW